MYLNVSRKGWKDILDLFFGIIVTKESYEMQGNASGLRPQDLLYCRFYFFFYFFFFHFIEVNVRKCKLIHAYLTGLQASASAGSSWYCYNFYMRHKFFFA